MTNQMLPTILRAIAAKLMNAAELLDGEELSSHNLSLSPVLPSHCFRVDGLVDIHGIDEEIDLNVFNCDSTEEAEIKVNRFLLAVQSAGNGGIK